VVILSLQRLHAGLYVRFLIPCRDEHGYERRWLWHSNIVFWLLEYPQVERKVERKNNETDGYYQLLYHTVIRLIDGSRFKSL
jgi:hypothetical protein